MSGEKEPCPECTIDFALLSREDAWDAFWSTSHPKHGWLIQRPVVSYATVNRADPTGVAHLSCGHTVPS